MVGSARHRLASPLLRGAILGVALCLLATAALAKDICISVANNFTPLTYVFEKPSIPEPGKLTSFPAVVFPGSGTAGNTPGVAHGTIYRKSTGKLRIGLSIQGMLATGLIYDHLFDDALVNHTFAGSDVVVTPTEATFVGTWTRVDCSTLTLP